MSFFSLFTGESSSSEYRNTSVKDPNTWDVEILSAAQMALENIGVPSISGGSINYTARDDNAGAAVGTVKYKVLGTEITLPFIITNFQLKPIDVFVYNRTFRPLTPTQLGHTLRSGSAVARPATADETSRKQAPLYSSVYPPNYGKYIFASDEFDIKTFAEKYGEGNHEKIYNAVTKDKDLLSKCAIAGIYDSIKKLANINFVPREFVPKADAVLFVKTGSKFKAISLCSSGDEIKVADIDEEILRESLTQHTDDPDAAAGKILMEGQYSIARPGGEPALYSEDIKEVKRSVLKPITRVYPSIASTVINGNFERGTLVGRHISPDLTPTGNMVFVSKNHYVTQPEIYGRVVKAPVPLSETEGLEPKPETTVFVVHESKIEDPVNKSVKSDVVAFGPLHVQAVSKNPGPTVAMEVSATDDFGNSKRLVLTRGLKTFVQKEGLVLTPVDVRFMSVNQRASAPTSYEETNNKLAIFFENPMLTVDSACGRFQFTGEAADSYRNYLEKNGVNYAFMDPVNYRVDEAKVALRVMGFNEESCKEILKNALDGPVVLHNAQTISKYAEVPGEIASIDVDVKKIADAAAVLAEAIDKSSEINKSEWTVKIAQEEKTITADKVLSLGLISPKNVSLFVEGIDEISEIVSFMSALLIAARIGMPVEEERVREAMFNLAVVEEQLRTLAASQKSSKKK
jgi:hypothetical protein